MNMNMNRQHEDKGHKDKKRCSIIGEFNGQVLSEMQKFSQYLLELSGEYGIEPRCISPWKNVFLDTIWVIFSSMFPVKFQEKECFLRENSLISPAPGSDPDPGPNPGPAPGPGPGPVLIRVNTVSSIFRRSTSPFMQYKNKYVPFLRLSGQWLESFGFEIGKKYVIYAMKNQLILRTSSCGSSSSCSCELDRSHFTIPDSRFPIPDSRFPIPDSRL